tara:strand:- start:165 stop:455 length:291 start_codon:yes stop_codon:yes gene_type:complete
MERRREEERNNMNTIKSQNNTDAYISDDEEIVLLPYTAGMGVPAFKQITEPFLKRTYVFNIGCTDKKNKKQERYNRKRDRIKGRLIKGKHCKKEYL